ncbi:MAG: hypothetical protein WCI05_05100 [Myxococcales bacterium]|jgi:hypothetical protein
MAIFMVLLTFMLAWMLLVGMGEWFSSGSDGQDREAGRLGEARNAEGHRFALSEEMGDVQVPCQSGVHKRGAPVETFQEKMTGTS